MTLILIIILLVVLLGGGFGYRSGYLTHTDPLGILLLIVVVILIVGLVLPYAGLRWYP